MKISNITHLSDCIFFNAEFNGENIELAITTNELESEMLRRYSNSDFIGEDNEYRSCYAEEINLRDYPHQRTLFPKCYCDITYICDECKKKPRKKYMDVI